MVSPSLHQFEENPWFRVASALWTHPQSLHTPPSLTSLPPPPSPCDPSLCLDMVRAYITRLVITFRKITLNTRAHFPHYSSLLFFSLQWVFYLALFQLYLCFTAPNKMCPQKIIHLHEALETMSEFQMRRLSRLPDSHVPSLLSLLLGSLMLIVPALAHASLAAIAKVLPATSSTSHSKHYVFYIIHNYGSHAQCGVAAFHTEHFIRCNKVWAVVCAECQMKWWSCNSLLINRVTHGAQSLSEPLY